VAADEARRAAGGGAHTRLRRADVRDRGLAGARRQRRLHLRRELCDRSRDHCEVGARDGSVERAAGLVERASRGRGLERGRIRVEAGGRRGHPGALRRERDGGPDQARSDHREAP
jgi:hypothetical protein